MLLKLLGPPALFAEARAAEPALSGGKPLALLAYLAVAGETSREELVTLLWGDRQDARARNAFRQTLHRLKAVTGPALRTDLRETLALADDERGLAIDLNSFQAAAAEGAVTEALRVYTGPFVQGLVTGERAFDDWAEAERRKIEATFLGTLDRAAADAFDAGKWNEALELSRRLTAADAFNVQACEREVRILLAAGRREEALRIASLHADAIAGEIGDRAASPLRELLQRARATIPAAARAARAGTAHRATPFVGRTPELSRLLALWRGTREERGGTALVSGPAGIGKTRLLGEFTMRARLLGTFQSATGRERGEWDIPYAGIADALRSLVHTPGVAGASRHLLAEAARLLPELRDRFDLPEPAPLRDDAELLRFFEGVAACLEAAAYDEPLYVQIDDFHRASPRSVQLASYLVDRLSAVPVLFAFALRTGDEPLPKHLTDFTHQMRQRAAAGSGAALLFDLPPLTPGEASELAGDMLGPGDGLRDAAVDSARGNPERLLAIARGDLAPDGSALVPLTAVLRERLAGSTQQEQRLFIAAAFFGRTIPIRLLAAATHLSEPAALDAALKLEQNGLLIQDGFGVATAHPESFELAVEGSGPAGCALLAGWAADALAGEADASAADLVRLYTASGRGADAARHVRRGALDAAAGGAHDAAVSLLERTLALPLEDKVRAELEALLRALGGGRPRLRGTVADADKKHAAAESEPVGNQEGAADAGETFDTAGWRASRWTSLQRLAPAAVALAVIGGALAFAGTRAATPLPRGTFLSDTLIVVDAAGGRSARAFPVTGSLIPVPRLGNPTIARPGSGEFDWVVPPWVNPLPSPDGSRIAVERVTPSTTHVYVITADAADTIPLATGQGEWTTLGWSPDGEWVLTLRSALRADGRESAQLYALEARPNGRRVAIDTVTSRVVTDAAWSPTGDRIAWAARDIMTRQQDVYVAGFGGGAVNVSSHRAEDYHLAWSPDGTTLAFTSERDGAAHVYSVELEPEFRLRQLTFGDARNELPAFSPDGVMLAFQSTREGALGVWLIPSFGGAPLRVTPPEQAFALGGWRASRVQRVVTAVQINTPDAVSVGDTFSVRATVVDQTGEPFDGRYVAWSIPTADVEMLPATEEDVDANRVMLIARRPGTIALGARVTGWRHGRAQIAVTPPPVTTIAEDFEDGTLARNWLLLGRSPAGMASGRGRGGTQGLVLRAGRPWQSGILSRDVMLLQPGTVLQAWVSAAFTSSGAPHTFTLALVDDDPALQRDTMAPQPFRLAHISWSGEARRLVYGAGSDARSEPAAAAGLSGEHTLAIAIGEDGRASFQVDGAVRWRSSTRVVEAGAPRRRARLWIGGTNTGPDLIFDDVVARTAPGRTAQRTAGSP